MRGPDAEEPLLSDEETSALLDAMREEETKDEVEVVTTDLGSPEGPMREALARADAAATEIGASARTQILVQTARGIDVDYLPAEVVPRDVLVSSFDPKAMQYELRSKGAVQGLLVIDSTLARYVLERSMGALDEEQASPVARGFSDLDRRVIAPFPRAIVAALSASFLDGRELTVAPLGEADELSGAARFEPMLRVGVRFEAAGNRAGELLIALNAAAVATSSPKAEAERAAAAKKTADVKRALRATVRGAEVELVAVLGRAASSVRQLLELQEGDVFRLDGSPNDALSMCVGDVVIARGAPVVVSGDLAVEITEVQGRTEAANAA